jgi:hypothetical protein
MFKIDTVDADLWSFSKGCNRRTHSAVAPEGDFNVTFDLSTNIEAGHLNFRGSRTNRFSLGKRI